MRQIVVVEKMERGIVAVLSDGTTWFLVDPYVETPLRWEQLPTLPLGTEMAMVPGRGLVPIVQPIPKEV